MRAISCLAVWSMLTFCPSALTLLVDPHSINLPSPDPQQNDSLTVGVDANVHCTQDPRWLSTGYPSIRSYDSMCQNALAKTIQDFASYGLDTELEFLDRGSTAQTTKPQVLLPRKYVATPPASQQSKLPSCTIAIAFIDSLEGGDPLPGQPPGPFGSSDIATKREMQYSPGYIGKPFSQCLRDFDEPSLGWARAGRAGNIGIFFMGTRSVMDRRITRAIHPNSIEEQ